MCVYQILVAMIEVICRRWGIHWPSPDVPVISSSWDWRMFGFCLHGGQPSVGFRRYNRGWYRWVMGLVHVRYSVAPASPFGAIWCDCGWFLTGIVVQWLCSIHLYYIMQCAVVFLLYGCKCMHNDCSACRNFYIPYSMENANTIDDTCRRLRRNAVPEPKMKIQLMACSSPRKWWKTRDPRSIGESS